MENDIVAELRSLILAQQTQISALQSEIAAIKRNVSSQPAPLVIESLSPRRAFLKKMLGVGAGALALGAVTQLGFAPTASADSEQPLVLGTTNTANAPTSLQVNTASYTRNAFRVDAVGQGGTSATLLPYSSDVTLAVTATGDNGPEPPLNTVARVALWAYTNTQIGGAILAQGAGQAAGISTSSENSYALIANSPNNTAISATGTIGGSFTGSQAPLYLAPASTTGAPTTGTHSAGEFFVDKNGALYYCFESGTPGKWAKLAGHK